MTENESQKSDSRLKGILKNAGGDQSKKVSHAIENILIQASEKRSNGRSRSQSPSVSKSPHRIRTPSKEPLIFNFSNEKAQYPFVPSESPEILKYYNRDGSLKINPVNASFHEIKDILSQHADVSLAQE